MLHRLKSSPLIYGVNEPYESLIYEKIITKTSGGLGVEAVVQCTIEKDTSRTNAYI